MRALSIHLCATALLIAFAHGADEDLPRRGKAEPAEAGEKLFLNDLGDALPAAEDLDLTALATDADVERARADFERAQRKQARWQKLGKAGVLSQVEVEAAVLQLARARVKHEQARAAKQQREVEALRARVAAGQVTKDALEAAESALQTAQTMAAEAAAGLQRTQLLQAEANLDRQRRLGAAGVGSKRQLQRAQTTLQQLKANP